MDTNTLSRLFRNPPAAYRPMIFWLWNGAITADEIRAQVADFAAQGCGGFFFHPMGENFRLKDFVQGMQPPYLSDAYFDLVRVAVEAAQQQGLYAWLYDEGGWPSGTAQGRVVDGHPEFRGKRLHARRMKAIEAPHLPPNTIAALGIPDLGAPVPVDLRELAQGMWPFDELIIFHVVDDGYPVDILNPMAVQRFIEVTHERYAAHVGEFFGSTIPGMFTDETSLGGRMGTAAVPWTGAMLEMLNEATGRDARLYLPLLLSPETIGPEIVARYSDHEIVAARCEYADLLTQRFGESYWQQINDWCAQHGLIHTGHVGGEDNLPDHLHFGHFFRTAGALHLPGVDVIWRQLFPGTGPGVTDFPFPRLASSARRQQGPAENPDDPWAQAVLTESNAVYGFGFHYGQMRWLADVQIQQGINLYAPMASYYTTAGGRLYGTMSHIGPGNPLWPDYAGFADTIGRQCLLARHTTQPTGVAVYYPIEAFWSDDGAAATWESVKHICRTLGERQIPFDFVDADVLGTLTTEIGQGVRPGLSYHTFIIPSCLAVPAAVLQKLAELREADARVLIVDHWPLQPAEMDGVAAMDEALARLEQAGAEPVPADDLPDQLHGFAPDDWLRLAEPEPQLLLSVRHTDEARLVFLTNNSAEVMEPGLVFHTPEDRVLEGWDARDGEIAAAIGLPGLEAVEIRPVLPPWSSLLFMVRPPSDDEEVLPPGEETSQAREFMRWLSDVEGRRHHPPHVDLVAEFTQADRATPVLQYLVEEGTVRLAREDLPNPYDGQPAPLWDWREWPMPDFSGEVQYEFEFLLADELAVRPLLLDLGQVFWTARVELNDEPLGTLLWAPYVLDLSGRVQAGTNRLRVTVVNTLANQACRPEVEAEARERGWCNPYLERALPMMREDLRSGLVGPVRLIVAEPRED